MKQRPIIFTGESVRGIQAGRKTQTRRVIVPQPSGEIEDCDGIAGIKYDGRWHDCPHGVPGDRLWCREEWMAVERPDGMRGILYSENSEFRAIENTPEAEEKWLDARYRTGWRSPIFMPRWASRLTLEIVSVRVQRVQDITEDDAVAEGEVPFTPAGSGKIIKTTAVHFYASTWNTLNAKRGGQWTSNPWVWAITFKQVKA